MRTSCRSGRLLLKMFLVFFLLIIAMVVGVWMYIPVLISRQATAALKAQLGEGTGLESVNVSLSDSSVTLNGFTMASEEVEAPLLSFSLEALRVRLKSIIGAINGNPEFTEVAVVRPRAVLAMEPGDSIPINLSDVMDRRGDLEESIQDVPSLENARIENGEIELRYFNTAQSPLSFENISVEVHGLPEVVTDGVGEVLINLSTDIVFGSQRGALLTSVRGNFTRGQHADFDVAMQVHDLSIQAVQDLFGLDSLSLSGVANAELQGRVTSGRLQGQLNFQFSQLAVTQRDPSPAAQFAGVPAATAYAFFNSPAARETMRAPVVGDLTDPDFDLVAAIREGIRASFQYQMRMSGAPIMAAQSTVAPQSQVRAPIVQHDHPK